MRTKPKTGCISTIMHFVFIFGLFLAISSLDAYPICTIPLIIVGVIFLLSALTKLPRGKDEKRLNL